MSVAPSKPPSFVTDPKKLLALVKAAQKKVADAKNQAAAVASVAVSMKKPTTQAGNILESFGSWINETGKSVGKAITVSLDDIEDFGTTLFKDFSLFIGEQTDALGRQIDDLKGGIGITIDQVGENLKAKVNEATNFVNSSLDGISANVSMLPQFVKETAESTVSDMSDRLKNLGSDIRTTVTSGIADTQAFFGKQIELVLEETANLSRQVAVDFQASVERIQKNASAVLDGIADSFNDAALYTLKGFSTLDSTIRLLFSFDAKSFIDIADQIATEQVRRTLTRTTKE